MPVDNQFADRQIIPVVEIDSDISSYDRFLTSDFSCLGLTKGSEYISTPGEALRVEVTWLEGVTNSDSEVWESLVWKQGY